jgi:integrase/recombinase XerD
MEEIYNFRKELQNLGYSKNVVASYPKYAQDLLQFTNKTYQKIQDTDIKNYYHYLQQKPSQRQQGLVSESHTYSQLLAIKIFFNYLERTYKIKRNPYNLRIKQNIRKERVVFTCQEIQELYKNCKTIEEKTILNLCYGCGLRKTEVELLKAKDLNFEQKLLFVRLGKGKKRRVIPLTQRIVTDLKKYDQYSKKYRTDSEDYFLRNKQGNPIKGHSIYSIFKALVQRTKKTDYRLYCLHSLRHSIATHLLENEMSIEMVRDFLGHGQLKTTQIYTRINLLKTELY